MKQIKLVLLTALFWAALSAGYLTSQAKDNKAEVALQAAIKMETVDGNLKGAIEQYKVIAALPGAGRATVAAALLRMGQCYEKLGQTEARAAYERLVRDYADQAGVVAQARVRLAAMGGPVPKPTGLQIRKLWVQDSPAVEIALTADGKYFRGIDGDTGDVVQFEVASRQRSRIKNRLPWNEKEKLLIGLQAFSRDGNQIAYMSFSEDEVRCDLRTRNLDGSGSRVLFSEKGSVVYPLDWSPDGRSILAVRERIGLGLMPGQGGAYEIIFISTADGSVRVLKSIQVAQGGGAKSTYARLSPDGRFVAFGSVGKGNPTHDDIFLVTADGRNEVVVAAHPAEDQVLAWAPDGKSFIFFSDRAGTWDIWSVPISEGKQQGEPELLKKDFGYNSDAAGFAPDGSLYYGTFTNSGGLYICEVDLETGKVPVPSAPVTTRYIGPPSQPSWSPDGKKLFYVSRVGAAVPGNNIITIWSAATGEERFLSPRLRSFDSLDWAPDGRSIIAQASTDTEDAIFRIDSETSEISKLADDGQVPRLCPDGKTLVFVKGGNIITKRNLDTGEVSEVAKAGGRFYDLSPDGRQVVFQVNGAVKVVSLNGGELRELFRGLAEVYRLRWTRDGRYIIAQALYTKNPQFWRVPAQGGAPLKLDLSIPKIGNSFTLNPDNRRFAYNIIETPKIELWVMENFLPPTKVNK